MVQIRDGSHRSHLDVLLPPSDNISGEWLLALGLLTDRRNRFPLNGQSQIPSELFDCRPCCHTPCSLPALTSHTLIGGFTAATQALLAGRHVSSALCCCEGFVLWPMAAADCATWVSCWSSLEVWRVSRNFAGNSEHPSCVRKHWDWTRI